MIVLNSKEIIKDNPIHIEYTCIIYYIGIPIGTIV